MTTTRSQARREAGERANVLAVWLDSKADGSDLTHREVAERQRMRAAEQLAAEFGTDVSEWTV